MRTRPRGPKPAPVGRPTPEFRRAALAAAEDSSLTALAVVAGFSQLSHLSTVLHADRVALTPHVVRRLRKLAEVISFRGDVFEAAR